MSTTTARVCSLILAAVSSLGAQSSAAAWRLTGSQTGEYGAAVDSTIAHSGSRSGRVDGWARAPLAPMYLTLPVRADQYRGKRVKVSAFLKTRDVRGAGAYLQVNPVIAGMGTNGASSERSAIKGTSDWQGVSVTANVHPTAMGIWVGAVLNGYGTLWVDDVSIEVLGEAVNPPTPPTPPAAANAQVSAMANMFGSLPHTPDNLGFEAGSILTFARRNPLEPPRALTTRGRDNLIAFARIAGVVRHFHPTNAVRTANWDDFLIRGVRAVESAPTADSLARTLTALFAPIAPTVRIAAGTLRPSPTPQPELGDRLAVAYWSNDGIVLSATSSPSPIYSSTLMTVPAPDGHPPAGTPHPDSVWTAALPGGVSAIVPTALWVPLPSSDQDRRAVVAPAMTVQEPASPNDRAGRLAGVISAWNVFQHAYPYFDVVKVDWSAALPRALGRAAVDSAPPAYLETLRRLVAALRDGHGGVYPMVVSTGRRAYLPVALDWIENRLVVTRVGAGAPPEIKRGDVIETIDGLEAVDALTRREEQISGTTPQWLRYRAVNDLLTGDSGTVARVRLATGATVSLPYSALTMTTDPLPEKITEIRPGVYYVDIGRITDDDFNTALTKLAQAQGVVFDLRGYPRSVNTPSILSHLSSGTIRSDRFEVPNFTHPDQQRVRYDRDGGWVVPPREPRFRGKIAFLTGGGAISYAESTMGIVEQFKLGEIVGGNTAGTNGNVNSFTVIGAYQVAYTGMRVRKRDETPQHGVGIKPTIPVQRTIRGVAAGHDEVLERAIAVVGGGIVP